MTAPKAILIDLDDTVYPYEPCHQTGMRQAALAAKALNEAWQAPETFRQAYLKARDVVKRTVPGQAAQHCRLLYFKNLVEAHLGRTDLGIALALHGAYWRGYFSAMKIDEDCARALATARLAGIRLAWVTNFTTERQMHKLLALELENAADLLVTSEEAGADKPNPAIFLLALAKLQVRADETWVIGDDFENDITPAKKLGMSTIWFQRDGVATPRDAVTVVSNWKEISQLLRAAKVRAA